ncbi:hypothetical protein KP509_01G081700 [Ceratopteris richardii]|uniref:Glycosyltransferase n=1 Tax=Ceratopteris richardii TaxID=49495 RepID=A0A8T2VMX5_CERRI|nr:hypothetical protein KP509_01G081700 [Ceratopteris richardii]
MNGFSGHKALPTFQSFFIQRRSFPRASILIRQQVLEHRVSAILVASLCDDEHIYHHVLKTFSVIAGNSVSKDSLVVEMGAPLSQRKQDSEVVTCIPGFPSGVPIQYLPFGTPMGDAGAEWLRKFMTECWDRVSQAQGVIGNSFEALEEDILEGLAQRLKEVERHAEDARRWPRSFRLVGPLVVDGILSGRAEEADETNEQISGTSFWKEEVTECIDWLDKQPVASVVYVAFGSLTVLTTAQVQEVLLGLAASGQKFLMVLRNDAIISKPLSRTESSDMALPTRLPVEEALPSGFLELYQERCKLVPWAPQALVLAHPSVGGFFSHCGWNSTLESLCCGVPILGWPWLMDQTSNCWLVSDVWRVGLRLSCDEANQTTKEEVEDGVRKLMEGSLAESLRARASKIRDQAREAARTNHIIVSLAKEIHHLALTS